MAPAHNSFRPHVEALEDRHLPSGVTTGWIVSHDGNTIRAVGVRLTFNQALDPARAADPSTYTLVGSDGKTFRQIAVRQAVHDTGPETVRLLWLQPTRLRVLRQLRVVVNGTVPGGLTNTAGQFLDGDQDGTPGGDAALHLKPRPGHVVQIPGGAGDPGMLRLLGAQLL